MNNTEINKARIQNRLFEQVEKDEMVENVISAYGQLIFENDQLKIDNKVLKEEIKRLLNIITEGVKP